MERKRPISEEVLKSPVGVANKMWRHYLINYSRSETWHKKSDPEKIQEFQNISVIFDDFIKKHDVPSKQLILNGEYHAKPFRLYLNDEKSGNYCGMEGWAKLQANYIKYLYLRCNKGLPGIKKKAHAIWESTWTDIFKKTSEFKQSFEEAKAKTDENHELSLERRRAELIRMVKESTRISDLLTGDTQSNPSG